MKAYKHLALTERYQILALLKSNESIISIAKTLGRDPTTIRREIKRGSTANISYNPDWSYTNYTNKRARCKSAHKLTPELVSYITDRIKWYWSPEQICGRLLLKSGIKLHPMSIYRFIYADATNGGELWRFMRLPRKKPKKRKEVKTIREYIKNRRSIHSRPEIIDNEERYGDLETDTIVGTNHKGTLVTICDRKSSYVWIGQPHSKEAYDVSEKIKKLLRPVKGIIHSITSDNGLEFARHERVSKSLGIAYYFADPYATNQRARIEHMNKLIRQFFPKDWDLRCVTNKECQIAAELLNDRPRKKLDFKTPKEVLFDST